MTNLQNQTDTTKAGPSLYDIYVLEDEIRFYEGAGLSLTRIEQSSGSNYVKIRVTISTPYDLMMFAYANKTYVKEYLTPKKVAA